MKKNARRRDAIAIALAQPGERGERRAVIAARAPDGRHAGTGAGDETSAVVRTSVMVTGFGEARGSCRRGEREVDRGGAAAHLVVLCGAWSRRDHGAGAERARPRRAARSRERSGGGERGTASENETCARAPGRARVAARASIPADFEAPWRRPSRGSPPPQRSSRPADWSFSARAPRRCARGGGPGREPGGRACKRRWVGDGARGHKAPALLLASFPPPFDLDGPRTRHSAWHCGRFAMTWSRTKREQGWPFFTFERLLYAPFAACSIRVLAFCRRFPLLARNPPWMPSWWEFYGVSFCIVLRPPRTLAKHRMRSHVPTRR